MPLIDVSIAERTAAAQEAAPTHEAAADNGAARRSS